MPAEFRWTAWEIKRCLAQKAARDSTKPAWKRNAKIAVTVKPFGRYRPGCRTTEVKPFGSVEIAYEGIDGRVDVYVRTRQLEKYLEGLESRKDEDAKRV